MMMTMDIFLSNPTRSLYKFRDVMNLKPKLPKKFATQICL